MLLAGLCAAGAAAEYVPFPNTDVTSYGASVLNAFVSAAVSNCDHDGGDFPTTDPVTATLQECAMTCAGNPACHAYTYSESESAGDYHTCYLKSSVTAISFKASYTCGVNPYYVPYPTGDTGLLKALCEETSGCDTLDGAGMLRSFASNSSLNSWISNTTCGAAGSASVTAGSCFTPSAAYVTCSASLSGVMEPFAHFDLPPFLVQKSCDSNPKCAGYMTTADESQGWLLQWASGSGGVAAVRIDGRQGR